LYEAKMIHHFDHRFATYGLDGSIRDTTLEEHQDPDFAPMPRYWVEEGEVEERLVKRDRDGNVLWRWEQPWLLGFRRITNSTNERTSIFSLIPRVAVGDNLFLAMVDRRLTEQVSALLATVSSLAFDFVTRQKLGGTNMNFFVIEQLPILHPESFSEPEVAWIQDMVAQIGGLPSVAGSATGSYSGSSVWASGDRARLRAVLDAYFLEKFGLEAEAAYILDTFTTTSGRELQRFGEYRTRRIILEALDERPWHGSSRPENS